MSFFQILESLNCLVYVVTSIYNWDDFTGFQKLFHVHQILLVDFRYSHETHFLSASPGNDWPQQYGLKQGLVDMILGTPDQNKPSLRDKNASIRQHRIVTVHGQ